MNVLSRAGPSPNRKGEKKKGCPFGISERAAEVGGGYSPGDHRREEGEGGMI